MTISVNRQKSTTLNGKEYILIQVSPHHEKTFPRRAGILHFIQGA